MILDEVCRKQHLLFLELIVWNFGIMELMELWNTGNRRILEFTELIELWNYGILLCKKNMFFPEPLTKVL